MSNNRSGQVLLLVLLAMAALATITLSVVARSVSDVSVTTREEESLRAFSAAEAGVEEGLVADSVGTVITKDLEVPADAATATVSTYTAQVDNYPENLRQYNYPFELLSGEAATVWFVTKNGDEIEPCASSACFNGNLRFCWGKPGSPQTSAVFLNVLYDSPSGYVSYPLGFDRDSVRRTGANANNFSEPSLNCTVGSQNYAYYTDINTSALVAGATPILLRVTMLYNDTAPDIFGVSTSANLPTQGRRVTSEGQAGESVRRINAFLLNPEMPFVFDSALYSSGSISK